MPGIHPNRSSPAAAANPGAFQVGMWAVLRSLVAVLLALLAINTVAVLLLNALYEPTALRSRHLWRPVLYRNLIFAAPWLVLLYFGSRAHRSVAREMHVRVTSLFTRLYRVGLWLALLIVS